LPECTCKVPEKYIGRPEAQRSQENIPTPRV